MLALAALSIPAAVAFSPATPSLASVGPVALRQASCALNQEKGGGFLGGLFGGGDKKDEVEDAIDGVHRLDDVNSVGLLSCTQTTPAPAARCSARLPPLPPGQ